MNRRVFAALALAVLASSLPALVAGARAGSSSRGLAEYAPADCEAWSITGDCVTEEGMQVTAGGDFLRFNDTCEWTLDLVDIARSAVKCLVKPQGRVCKLMGYASPKGTGICVAICTGIDTVKKALKTTTKCAIKNGVTGSSSPPSSGGSGCFPGSALVRTHNGTLAPLRSVAPGEAILAVRPDGRTDYSKMFMLTAPMPHRRATFVRISTEAGLTITVTPNHYLFALCGAEAEMSDAAPGSLNAWRYVLPTEISVGDVVPVVPSGAAGAGIVSSRVTKVEMVEDVGIFMPHTAAGAVVVGGVVATQLTTTAPKWMARHWIARPALLALHRALSLLPPGPAKNAAERMSLAVHGVKPTGMWAKSEL